MAKRSMFVGLDVHKDSIDISLAEGGRDGEVRHDGVVRGDLEAVANVVRARRAPTRRLRFVYEGRRVEGPAPVDGPLPSARGPRQGEAEGRDGDCARTDGVHLGDRAGGAHATRVHEAMCRSVRPAASRLAGEPSEPLGTSGSPIRPCRGRGSPRRTTVWAVPNPRRSAASTVARTRCRRPDGSEDRSKRTRASATRKAEAGSICSIDN